MAQAIHAAVELRAQQDVPETVVVLSVQDETELLLYADILSGWCSPAVASIRPHVVFHEPDLGEHTALATVSDGAEFASLPLAGGCLCD